ncbi:hypothetical protein LR013_04665, partial [candidate division NPL-UPA2 bacterium]|nr:hypothetical protein [candidate division NPL-UPA2 bacterium]
DGGYIPMPTKVRGTPHPSILTCPARHSDIGWWRSRVYGQVLYGERWPVFPAGDFQHIDSTPLEVEPRSPSETVFYIDSIRLNGWGPPRQESWVAHTFDILGVFATTPHLGRANALFYDGSVRSVTADELRGVYGFRTVIPGPDG